MEYAQFLHDASEIQMATRPAEDVVMNEEYTASARPEDIAFTLPSKRPDVEVPVIELFLAEGI